MVLKPTMPSNQVKITIVVISGCGGAKLNLLTIFDFLLILIKLY